MAWYLAILLGLVQGIAEFLPISSSGHLLLLTHFLGITDGGLLLTIVLHLATLLAVVVVYWRQIGALCRHPFRQQTNWQLLVATIITVALVLLLQPWADQLYSFAALPVTFCASGVILLLPRVCQPRPKKQPWVAAVVMGAAQGLASLPGLTRSGLTITAGQLAGQDKTQAADFSFLMSIPVILGSLIYELLRGGSLGHISWSSLLFAFVAAFVSGLLAVRWLLKLLRKVDLRWFSVYLFVLAGGLLLYRCF